MSNISKITNIQELSFKEHHDLFVQLKNQAGTQPETALSLLPDLYHILTDKGLSPDMIPTAAETFGLIIKNAPKPEINKALTYILSTDKKDLINRGAYFIMGEAPQCADILFNLSMPELTTVPYSEDTKNHIIPLVNKLSSYIEYAPFDIAPRMFEKTECFEPAVQKIFFTKNGTLYQKQPLLRDKIWEQITSSANSDKTDLSALYDNLNSIIKVDNSKTEAALAIIKKLITNERNTPQSLSCAYKTLDIIFQTGNHTKEINEILNTGITNPNNTPKTKKQAYRMMGKFDELTSRSSIGKRIEKSSDNPYGFKKIESIDADETALLFLGGDGTLIDKVANGYLSDVDKLLKKHNMDGKVSLYAAVYDFGERDDYAITFNAGLARQKMMEDHHHNTKVKRELNNDTINPKYIEDIFNNAILKRISSNDGKRLTLEEAMKRMRKLTFVAHCHGAYTFLKLEEMMQVKMKELGYSANECKKIQKETLCITHAPFAPLGVSKSTMISFASVQDFEPDHFNNFEIEIRNLLKNKEFKLSYFPEKQGCLFLTPQMGKDVEEHNFIGYNTSQRGLGNAGKTLMILAGNTIVNGIKNSLNEKPLPSVKDLVCNKDETSEKLFEKISRNGKEMMTKIKKNAHTRIAMEKKIRAKRIML